MLEIVDRLEIDYSQSCDHHLQDQRLQTKSEVNYHDKGQRGENAEDSVIAPPFLPTLFLFPVNSQPGIPDAPGNKLVDCLSFSSG